MVESVIRLTMGTEDIINDYMQCVDFPKSLAVIPNNSCW